MENFDIKQKVEACRSTQKHCKELFADIVQVMYDVSRESVNDEKHVENCMSLSVYGREWKKSVSTLQNLTRGIYCYDQEVGSDYSSEFADDTMVQEWREDVGLIFGVAEKMELNGDDSTCRDIKQTLEMVGLGWHEGSMCMTENYALIINNTNTMNQYNIYGGNNIIGEGTMNINYESEKTDNSAVYAPYEETEEVKAAEEEKETTREEEKSGSLVREIVLKCSEYVNTLMLSQYIRFWNKVLADKEFVQLFVKRSPNGIVEDYNQKLCCNVLGFLNGKNLITTSVRQLSATLFNKNITNYINYYLPPKGEDKSTDTELTPDLLKKLDVFWNLATTQR